MNRFVFPVLLLAMVVPVRSADAPVQFHLTFPPMTVEQTNMVLNKLGELPWKDANAILQPLITQANEQSKATAPQPPASSPPEAPK